MGLGRSGSGTVLGQTQQVVRGTLEQVRHRHQLVGRDRTTGDIIPVGARRDAQGAAERFLRELLAPALGFDIPAYEFHPSHLLLYIRVSRTFDFIIYEVLVIVNIFPEINTNNSEFWY